MSLVQTLQGIGRPVAYYPALNKLTGSVTATILLCQFIYWHGKGHDPDGWIYKTGQDLEEETGLSRREQETARKKLKAAGLLDEKYQGIPRKLFYRLNADAIDQQWQTIMADSAIMERRNPPDSSGGTSQAITETTHETTTETIPPSEAAPGDSRTDIDVVSNSPYALYSGFCDIKGKPVRGEGALPEKSIKKQLAYAKQFLADGYTVDQGLRLAAYLQRDPFWSEKGFDIQTLRQQVEKWVLNGEPAGSQDRPRQAQGVSGAGSATRLRNANPYTNDPWANVRPPDTNRSYDRLQARARERRAREQAEAQQRRIAGS